MPSIPMIDIILKLTLIDDMINFLSNTLNSAINTDLTDDVLVVLTLTKLKALINWLGAVGYDVFQLEWSETGPFGFDDMKSYTRWDIRIRLVGTVGALRRHNWLSSHSIFSKQRWSFSHSTQAESLINLIKFLVHRRWHRHRSLCTLCILIRWP